MDLTEQPQNLHGEPPDPRAVSATEASGEPSTLIFESSNPPHWLRQRRVDARKGSRELWTDLCSTLAAASRLRPVDADAFGAPEALAETLRNRSVTQGIVACACGSAELAEQVLEIACRQGLRLFVVGSLPGDPCRYGRFGAAAYEAALSAPSRLRQALALREVALPPAERLPAAAASVAASPSEIDEALRETAPEAARALTMLSGCESTEGAALLAAVLRHRLSEWLNLPQPIRQRIARALDGELVLRTEPLEVAMRQPSSNRAADFVASAASADAALEATIQLPAAPRAFVERLVEKTVEQALFEAPGSCLQGAAAKTALADYFPRMASSVSALAWRGLAKPRSVSQDGARLLSGLLEGAGSNSALAPDFASALAAFLAAFFDRGRAALLWLDRAASQTAPLSPNAFWPAAALWGLGKRSELAALLDRLSEDWTPDPAPENLARLAANGMLLRRVGEDWKILMAKAPRGLRPLGVLNYALAAVALGAPHHEVREFVETRCPKEAQAWMISKLP